jgi:hypothetical protein
MKLELFRHIFEKYSNNKFRENPFSESRVPCGRTDRETDRQANMTKLNNSFLPFCERAYKSRRKVNVRVKVLLYLTPHCEGILASALDGGEMSASRPGRFTPVGIALPYPLDRKLGVPQSWLYALEGERNLLPLPGI